MAADDHSDAGRASLSDLDGVIDIPTFEQILEMDDDEDERDFSRQIVLDFFEQAETCFNDMDDAVRASDLRVLSEKGHFLKGSSATLGLVKVKDSCEKIQHWGSGKDEHGDNDLDKTECVRKIREIIPVVKRDCEEAQKKLKRFYGEE